MTDRVHQPGDPSGASTPSREIRGVVPKSRCLARNRRIRWISCLLLVPVALTGLLADETNEDDDEAGQESAFYETAVVRARPVDRATAAVTIVDRETIESHDVVSVSQLLNFVPGINVASTGPRGGFATAQTRGGDPNYTQILIDGVPLNDMTDQVGGSVNVNSLSTAFIERIEVVRGPLSSSMGSTGLAGAINIITKRGSTDSPELLFGLAAGNHNTIVGSAALARGNEERDYFVGVTWEEEEDAIDAPGAHDSFEQWTVQGNARYELGSGAELRVSGRLAVWEAEDYPEVSGGPLLGSGDLRFSEHEELSLGVEARFGNPERQHRIQATAYRHDLERDSPFIFNPGNPPSSVPRSIEDTSYTTWQLGWTAPQWQFKSSRLNVGVDVRVDDGETDSSFPDIPLDQSYRIDRTTVGAFVEYVIERGAVLFELGARVDDPEDFDTEISPRAGVVVQLADGRTRLRSSIGRSFKLPSFFALAVPVFGNPDLDAESVLGIDAGVEQSFPSAAINVSLTLFFNRFEDLVDFSDAAFGFINVPEVESRGAELGLDWRPCSRVLFRGNVTHVDFDDQPANVLTQRPEWYGGAQLVWNVGKRTRWELDGQWVSEVFDFQVPLGGTFPTQGYQLYGTAVNVDLVKGWALHARIDNLADKEYEPYIGFPGPGRSFRIGARYGSGSGE